MLRAVLFDLGDTLIDGEDVPLSGAIDMLTEVSGLRDAQGTRLPIGLVSDYTEATSPASVARIKAEYCAILVRARIARFFRPFERRVTLSTEVGVSKPAPLIFRTAIDRLVPAAAWQDVVFVTENRQHVVGARKFGMTAIQFKGRRGASGQIARLSELPPLLRRMLRS